MTCPQLRQCAIDAERLYQEKLENESLRAKLALAAEQECGDREVIANAMRLLRAMRANEWVFSIYGSEAVDAYNALWESLGRPDLTKPNYEDDQRKQL